jgi:hypothetical protein
MNDQNYWRYGCYELTMEFSCCINVGVNELPTIWEDNKKALIEFTKGANAGLRGVIQYQSGLAAKYVSIQVDKREPIFKTNEHGEYYVLLLPGSYNLSVMLNCDTIYTTKVNILSSTSPLVLNITLEDKFYFASIYYRLDKYALFCTKSKAPVDCTLGKNMMIGKNSSPRFNLAGFYFVVLSILFSTFFKV